MRIFLTLLIIIPNISWGLTIEQSINLFLNTEIEVLLKLALEGLIYFIFICLVLYLGAVLMDKSQK